MLDLAVSVVSNQAETEVSDIPRSIRVFDGVAGVYRPLSDGSAIRSSHGAGWRGAILEHHKLRPMHLERVFFPETMVMLHLSGPNVIKLSDGEQVVEKCVQAGEVTVIPRGTIGCFRSWEVSEVLLLSLGSATLTCAASSTLEGAARADLRLGLGIADRTLQTVLFSLKGELEARHPSGNVYAESLCHSVALQLVKHHSNAPVRAIEPRASNVGLPRHLLRRALDFIYENATAEVTLTQIASSVRMSPFHFSRLFKQSVGEPPYRHLLRHRLRCGVEMLVTRGMTISQVASEIGFVDQSHFALHFKRFYGVTPRVFLRAAR